MVGASQMPALNVIQQILGTVTLKVSVQGLVLNGALVLEAMGGARRTRALLVHQARHGLVILKMHAPLLELNGAEMTRKQLRAGVRLHLARLTRAVQANRGTAKQTAHARLPEPAGVLTSTAIHGARPAHALLSHVPQASLGIVQVKPSARMLMLTGALTHMVTIGARPVHVQLMIVH